MEKAKSEPVANDTPVAALFQLYAPELLNYARRHTGSREDAEDIVLVVFLAALESDRLLSRNEQEQAAWLWRVTKNKTADYLRHTMRHASHAGAKPEYADETVYVEIGRTPDEEALRGEEYAELRDAVGRLPELQQRILHLRFAQGMRCTEIAQRLGKGDGAVRMLLSRSLNALRRVYSQSAGEDAL